MTPAGTGTSVEAPAERAGRKRADAVRNREKVIAAAEQVFAEQGIEAGIPEIAERAGVGKGTTPGRLLLLGLVAVGWYFSTLLLPGANYLPTGTQPFIFCFTPSVVGQSNEVTSEAYTAIEQFVGNDPDFSPKVKTYFTVASAPFFTGMGVRVKDEFANDRMMDQMAGKLMEVGFMQPGFQFFFASRTSIFRVPDKEFTLEITGPDLEEIRKISERVQGEIRSKVGPYLQPGPVPVRSGFSEGVPELSIHVDRYKAAEMGLNLSDVANVVETMIAGLNLSMAVMWLGIAYGSMPGNGEVLGAIIVFSVVLMAVAIVGPLVAFLLPMVRIQGEIKRLAGSDVLGTRPDGWRWRGMIYYAPEDPALFVPKRWGIGQTLNLARPGAWVFLGVLTLLPLVLAAATALFSR